MRLQPPGFVAAVAELCRAHEVHLILDEVFVAFGRLGSMLVCGQERVTPDFLCLAKGLTAGYLPLAATLAREEIFCRFSRFVREPAGVFSRPHFYRQSAGGGGRGGKYSKAPAPDRRRHPAGPRGILRSQAGRSPRRPSRGARDPSARVRRGGGLSRERRKIGRRTAPGGPGWIFGSDFGSVWPRETMDFCSGLWAILCCWSRRFASPGANSASSSTEPPPPWTMPSADRSFQPLP